MNGIIIWLPVVAAGRLCLESRIQLTVLSASGVRKLNSCQRQPIETAASIGVEKDGQTGCQIRQVIRPNTQVAKYNESVLDIKHYLLLGSKPATYKGYTCYDGADRNVGLS